MKNIDDVCIVVQARLGSQRVPGKMLRPFSGTTLVDILFEKLKYSKIIPSENIYFSAYEGELKEVGRKHNINIFDRSKQSAFSEGEPLSEIYDWWDKLPFKYAIQVNACHPFLTIESIDSFVEKYMEVESDGQFAVIEKHNYFWNKNGDFMTPWPEGQSCLNTKAVEITYEAAHCLYAGRMNEIAKGIWMAKSPFVKNSPALFVVPEIEVFDIDYPWQFNIAESLYRAIF